MPLLVKAAIIGKIKGNPWRMIVPTYGPLPTNRALKSKVCSKFGKVESKNFLMGGIIVIVGRKLSI
jgi:hypothetical protein